MRKAAIGIAAVAAMIATPALAADMALKAPPPPAPISDWTGFYLGADVGGYGSRQSATANPVPPGFGTPSIAGAGLAGFGLLPTSSSLNKSGVLGGPYAGYNWQMHNWLLGVEGDFTFLNRNVSDTENLFATFPGAPTLTQGPATVTLNSQTQWLASLRGRVGVVNNNWMVYATGGAAFTETKYSASLNPGVFVLGAGPSLFGGGGLPSATSFTQNKVGFAVGAGVEWMVAPHWLVRAEYLYYRFDGSNGFLAEPVTGVSGPCPGCGWNTNFSALQFNTGRVGLSYKF